MNRTKDSALSLTIAITLLAAWYLFTQSQGGLSSTAVPAYAEAIEHAVAPQLTGRIVEVHVKLGEAVKAGQALAQLDDRFVRLERARASAELEQLRAARDAQDLISKDDLLWYAMRNSTVLADESAARSDAENLGAELARIERLRAERLVDATTEAAVRRDYLAAQARVKVYEARRARLPELSGTLDRRQIDLQTQARVRPYREAIAAKEASIAELDQRLAELTLRAPVDGIVSQLTRPVGDVVPAGGEVLRLVRGRPGYVVATVPEERARGLQVGLPLKVRPTRGFWVTGFRGTVVELGPAVEQLPERSWLTPHLPRWGRRAVIRVDAAPEWKAGDRLYVHL